MVNHRSIIIHETGHKKRRRHEYDIYKEDRFTTPKQVVNIFDLGCLGIEKDFSDELSSFPYRKKVEAIPETTRIQQNSS